MKKRTLERISLAVAILCIWLSNMVLPNLDLNESLYQALKRGLGGICGAAVGLWVFYKDGRKRWGKAGPQERREMELNELDERNVAIREKAAAFSYEVGGYMLAGAFIVLSILDCLPGQIAVVVIFLCQMVVYSWRSHWLKKQM